MILYIMRYGIPLGKDDLVSLAYEILLAARTHLPSTSMKPISKDPHMSVP